ncbi:retrovirus-related Pol polyprotein from transposon 17.6 [Trichonephila clavipes]|nr:retrovirus-related Pol polyprotein from transposon 17.6 [Trichonephila clavipes]
MSEKALVDHIFVRLEPQVQDYVEMRNPQTTIQLLEVLAKFEERYSCKATLGPRNSNNVEGRCWNERRMCNVGNNRGNWRNSEVVHRPNNDKPGLTQVLYHEIDTGDNPPVVFRPYRYDRLKPEILDYHVDKMLKEGTIISIQSPYTSPVVLCRNNNVLPPDNLEAYRFAVDYRKLNAITKYPRYPLPLIDDLIMNILHTGIMSALDLQSAYLQMAVNPSDIVKTAFVTKNGT